MARIDLTGKQFGRLTVIEDAGKDRRGEYKWKCRCECGNETIVYSTHLRKGNTVSCGCVMRTTNKSHGESKTRLYKIWQHVKGRCDNPNADNYQYYGGRGINYTDEWKNFETFKEWAMSNGYEDNLSIDRINPNGNYEPGNCRWVTMEEQHRNVRKAVWITHDGITDTLRGWSRRLGVSSTTLSKKYRKGEEIFE